MGRVTRAFVRELSKMQQVDVRQTAVRNWENGILHEVQPVGTPEIEQTSGLNC
jgi:hypothetical protein